MKSKLKTAFIVGKFPVLSRSFILDHIIGLMDRGHEVRIFASQNPGEDFVDPDVQKYNLAARTVYLDKASVSRINRLIASLVLFVQIFIKTPPGALKALILFLKNRHRTAYTYFKWIKYFVYGNYDIIHCHFGTNALSAVDLKKMGLRAGLIVTFHGYDVTTAVIEKGKHLYDELFTVMDLATYNSRATCKKMIDLGCPPEKTVHLPMGIHTTRIPFIERSLAPDQPVRVLSVGRLVEMKGRQYAIEAIAKVAEKYPDIQYDIVGDGPQREHLEEITARLKMTRNITFHGWVPSDKLSQLYRSAHLFLHPSVTASNGNQEGQGVVLGEAQAYGLPVIATDHSAFPDSIIDGKTGFLVPERDVDAMAQTVLDLISRSEQWPAIGKAGRAFVEETFDSVKLMEQLEKIYFSVLEMKK